jgi:hypothetical protein
VGDNPNVKGKPCDTILWPALLTQGAPIAGPGVNPRLLGTVTRTDLPGLGAVQQVTYAGWPLVPILPRRGARGNRRRQRERSGGHPGRYLVPARTRAGAGYRARPNPGEIHAGRVARLPDAKSSRWP